MLSIRNFSDQKDAMASSSKIHTRSLNGLNIVHANNPKNQEHLKFGGGQLPLPASYAYGSSQKNRKIEECKSL